LNWLSDAKGSDDDDDEEEEEEGRSKTPTMYANETFEDYVE